MENRRLYRSLRHKSVAGVCGGLGEYFKMDPVIWRVIFVVLAIAGASGVLIYIILWIALPEAPSGFQHFADVDADGNVFESNAGKHYTTESDFSNSISDNGPLWGGIILILLGFLFLMDKFIPRIHFGDLWPILLIAIGSVLLHNAYKATQDRNDNK